LPATRCRGFDFDLLNLRVLTTSTLSSPLSQWRRQNCVSAPGAQAAHVVLHGLLATVITGRPHAEGEMEGERDATCDQPRGFPLHAPSDDDCS